MNSWACWSHIAFWLISVGLDCSVLLVFLCTWEKLNGKESCRSLASAVSSTSICSNLSRIWVCRTDISKHSLDMHEADHSFSVSGVYTNVLSLRPGVGVLCVPLVAMLPTIWPQNPFCDGLSSPVTRVKPFSLWGKIIRIIWFFSCVIFLVITF